MAMVKPPTSRLESMSHHVTSCHHVPWLPWDIMGPEKVEDSEQSGDELAGKIHINNKQQEHLKQKLQATHSDVWPERLALCCRLVGLFLKMACLKKMHLKCKIKAKQKCTKKASQKEDPKKLHQQVQMIEQDHAPIR